MKSLTCVVIGDENIAKQLGKKGTASDMTLYNHADSEAALCAVYPNGFPEKLQPLLQAIAMADVAVLDATEMNKSVGEAIVSLDAAGLKNGFVICADPDYVRAMAKGTVVEGYRFMTDATALRQLLLSVGQAQGAGAVKMPIDHSFDVKGVGTVALGIVRRGCLNVHDELDVAPTGKRATVRSLQVHDVDVQTIEAGSRAGVALRGVESKDIGRGCILCAPGSLKIATEISVKFAPGKFYKGVPITGQRMHLSIGLQAGPATVLSYENSMLSVKLDKPMAFDETDIAIAANLDSGNLRVMGSGRILTS